MPVIKRKRGSGLKPRVKQENILLGMELEFTRPNHDTSGSSADPNARFQKAVETWAEDNGFYLDASHRDGGGVEVVTKPYNFDWWRENGLNLFGFMKEADKLKFIGDSPYAGIHVHIDRNIFVYDQFVMFIKFIADARKILLPLSRRKGRVDFITPTARSGKTGSPFIPSNELKSHFNSFNGIYGNNCMTLNSNGKGTIECRFFNGSNDPEEAMCALEFVRCACYFIKSSRDKDCLSFLTYVKDYKSKYPSLFKQLTKLKLYTATGNVSEAGVSKLAV